MAIMEDIIKEKNGWKLNEETSIFSSSRPVLDILNSVAIKRES